MPRDNDRWLSVAAKTAEKGIRKGWGGPFGAVITHNGKMVAAACNTVLKSKDTTCHAEINAIRLAARKHKPLFLEGCVVYSTTEPCPMCFAALHWARVKTIVYSTTIRDVQKLGFNEMPIGCQTMKRRGQSPVRIERVAHADCKALLKTWSTLPKKKTY